MQCGPFFKSNSHVSPCLQRFKATWWLIVLSLVSLSSCQKVAQIKQRFQSSSEPHGQICSKSVNQCVPSQIETFRGLFKPTLPSQFTIEYYLEFGIGGSYFFPTEMDPESLYQELGRLNGIKKSQKSVQIAVGTERGFLTAVTDSLILADTDTLVRLYNVINVGLLKAARDIKSYRDLRFAQNIEIWKQHQVVFETDIDQDVLYAFWTKAQASPTLQILSQPPPFRMSFIHQKFGQGTLATRIPLDNDYVWNHERFLKLHQMAIQNKIFVYQIDFTKKNEVKDLIDLIDENTLDLQFVDLSNIHYYEKLSTELLEAMSMFKASRIILSQLYVDERGQKVSRFPGYWVFLYYVLSPYSDYKVLIRDYVEKVVGGKQILDNNLVTVLKDSNVIGKTSGTPCEVRSTNKKASF